MSTPLTHPLHSDSHLVAVVSGYYGFNNLGDELILNVLCDGLKEMGYDIIVLSANPEETAKTYGVRAIHRTKWNDILDAFDDADVFISGGGGLFQDVTGPGSVLYYGGLIHLARMFNLPVVIWGQGVGPLQNTWARWLTKLAFSRCASVQVRDERSASLLSNLKVKNVHVSADPVWLYKVPFYEEPFFEGKIPTTPYTVGVSLRSWPSLTPDRIQALAGILYKLVEPVFMDWNRSVDIMLLPFQPEQDREVLTQLENALKMRMPAKEERFRAKDDPRVTIHWATPESLLKDLGRCDVLFGMRFHSLLLGISAKVPVYGIIYDPKVQSLLNMFQLPGVEVESLETLSSTIVRESLSAYIPPDPAQMQEKAWQNFLPLHQLVYGA
jgi:polysaccharide pyruvyl transferase CsaB